MKASEILAFAAGAAAAVGVTLLFTTDKGKEIRKNVSQKLSKEEIDKLIEKLKKQREAAPSETEDDIVDEVAEVVDEVL
ncbi:MAG: YtxH domain-containing protein [Bacteroidales bacterium]|nr:YtxH domain-containing protein [Bacteroidales bacterium]